MKQIKDTRPIVEMSRSFIDQVILPALSENPGVRTAVAGFYEGRQLAGRYVLQVTGVRLVPAPDESASPNGTLS